LSAERRWNDRECAERRDNEREPIDEPEHDASRIELEKRFTYQTALSRR